jgi:hypothetical protein
VVSTNIDTNNEHFLLDKWLYKRKPIKSNLELTKSLKLIQPILEETVQKKYTTSRMWESFQGPLTWQHFCRLAFVREDNAGGSGGGGGGSGGGGVSSAAASKSNTSVNNSGGGGGPGTSSQANQTAAGQGQNQNAANYEPEPIPALLVSSSDKDWQTVAPYAVKFWDKLGLEPYSKYKNVAYLVTMPDLEGSTNPTTGLEDTANSVNNSENTIQQAVKDYFKELSSAYELCRLGVHRPALRIAADTGLVHVPLYNSGEPAKTSAVLYPGVKVDQWFDRIQLNKSSRYIGKQLKLYAKALKALALRIKSGHTSTIATTTESTFFELPTVNLSATTTASSSSSAHGGHSKKASGSGLTQQPPATSNNSFQSSFIPIMSTINLDKTIYEELKPSSIAAASVMKQEPVVAAFSHSPSLSNILTQSLSGGGGLGGGDLMTGNHSPLDFSGTHGQPNTGAQAQILNFNNNNNNDSSSHMMNAFGDTSGGQAAGQQLHNGQPIVTSRESQHHQSLMSLNFNVNSPPSLFLYMIDPFEYNVHNSVVKLSEMSGNNEMDLEPEFTHTATDDRKLNEYDLRRLVKIGLYKAYSEFFITLPDLFRYSTQFEIIPLSFILDVEQRAAHMCVKSMQMTNQQGNGQFAAHFAAGFGSNFSDLDMDFKASAYKLQAFNTFSKTKRFFMSPAHNYYLTLNQQQQTAFIKPKSLTGFGPAAHEDRFLKENLLASVNQEPSGAGPKLTLSRFRQLQFYAPLFILAPSTITTQTINMLASNLFFKNGAGNTEANCKALSTIINGDCSNTMPNFIQLNMSNSHYGYLNLNLNDVLHNQQQLLLGSSGGSNSGLSSNSVTSASASGSGTSLSNANMASGGLVSGPSAATSCLMTTTYQQQCNVLYVSYCLTDDQKYLLTCCTDENGELLECTSIQIEVAESGRRRETHARRVALRKLWEFIVTVISQTCKPWRLVIGRLGRLGHSELRAWACLLSKKNLQHVCAQLKEQCDTCATLANMEMPCILSACLVSMETCDTVCVYPEACSREDKIAAAALTGQQAQLAAHAAQAHGVSCTHILTFPVSAVIQTQSAAMSGMLSGMSKDEAGKAGPAGYDDVDFLDFFKFEAEEMNDIILNDPHDAKALNESGQAGEGEAGGVGAKDKYEAMLDQEEIVHLDQQPLAVGYYVSTARCGPLPRWLRGDVSTDTNYHTFKVSFDSIFRIFFYIF